MDRFDLRVRSEFVHRAAHGCCGSQPMTDPSGGATLFVEGETNAIRCLISPHRPVPAVIDEALPDRPDRFRCDRCARFQKRSHPVGRKAAPRLYKPQEQLYRNIILFKCNTARLPVNEMTVSKSILMGLGECTLARLFVGPFLCAAR